MIHVRLLAPILALVLLSACGGVQIKPEPALPKALLTPIPAKVAVVVPEEMRTFVHKETRWGVSWEIDLGAGHQRLAKDLFSRAFSEIVEVPDLAKAKEIPGVAAFFEPRIEQYSFATARETGGRYYAVTIRYRINLYTPEGELADSYTLTGYGNALAKGISSGKPLTRASVAAMRDAAAKFLVQFPEQNSAKRLANREPLEVETATASAEGINSIEAVPIDEPGTEAAYVVPYRPELPVTSSGVPHLSLTPAPGGQ